MPQGVALRRNGTCVSQETNCGRTISPFYSCCPEGTYCSNPYNQICCDSASNCTSEVVARPACAKPSADLYNNGGVDSAYFCCLNTSTGYAITDANANGCASSSYVLRNADVRLQVLSQAVTSTQSSTTSTTSAAPSASTTSSDPPRSSSVAGTVAGAVVGAVAGLIFITVLIIWLRKRSRSKQNALSPGERAELFTLTDRKELAADGKPLWLQTTGASEVHSQSINELPSNAAYTTRTSPITKRNTGQSPVELP